MHNNIVLIGMPGAGKSQLGKALAQRLDKTFLDGDKLIEQREQKSLQNIINQQGYLRLRQIEADVLNHTALSNTVLATGGSAVYSETAMAYLAAQATVIYLQCSISCIRDRIGNYGERGLAKPAEQSFDELFAEREPLYQQYADIVFNNETSLEKALDTIMAELSFAK